MSHVLAVLLALLFLPPLDVSAQDDEALPACNASEVLAIWTALADFDMPDITTFTDNAASDDLAARAEAIAELSDVQRRWWGDIAPDLPQCWLGQKTAIVFGRVLDEALILALMRYSGDQAAAAGDADTAARFHDAADIHDIAAGAAAYVLEHRLNLFP